MASTSSRSSELSTTSLMCSGRLLSPRCCPCESNSKPNLVAITTCSRNAFRLLSELDQDLDRLAPVHCAVAVGHPVEVRDSVEDAAGFDPSFEDVRQQLVDVRTGGSGTATDGDVVEKGRQRRRNRLLLGKADAADGAARTDDTESGDGRLLVADALEHGMGAEAVRKLADALDCFVASLADDV